MPSLKTTISNTVWTDTCYIQNTPLLTSSEQKNAIHYSQVIYASVIYPKRMVDFIFQDKRSHIIPAFIANICHLLPAAHYSQKLFQFIIQQIFLRQTLNSKWVKTCFCVTAYIPMRILLYSNEFSNTSLSIKIILYTRTLFYNFRVENSEIIPYFCLIAS